MTADRPLTAVDAVMRLQVLREALHPYVCGSVDLPGEPECNRRAREIAAGVRHAAVPEVPGLREALERMREFASHQESCIFAADLSGINGDEWAGESARRCNCGFDDALDLMNRVTLASPAPETAPAEPEAPGLRKAAEKAVYALSPLGRGDYAARIDALDGLRDALREPHPTAETPQAVDAAMSTPTDDRKQRAFGREPHKAGEFARCSVCRLDRARRDRSAHIHRQVRDRRRIIALVEALR